MEQTASATKAPPTLIENACWGIGDAVVYAWLMYTLRAAGHDVMLKPLRNLETFRIFGVPEEWWDMHGSGIANHPPKGYFEGLPWLRAWIKGYGFPEDLPLVRPPFIESAAEAIWAEETWKSREREHGTGPRVLICPKVVWKIREWPDTHFERLQYLLVGKGMVPIVLLQDCLTEHHYMWALGGTSQRQLAALIASADLVVGNDSGPAHFGYTIGRPTVVLFGGSRQDNFYAHAPEVIGIHVDPQSLPCVGCGWEGSRGHRRSCEVMGCSALHLLSPVVVADRISQLLSGGPRVNRP